MNYTELKKQWLAEEQASFKGWDFSHLDGRWDHEEELPWSYSEWVNTYRKSENKLLDMGTGGGEFLLTLNHPYENTVVTEEWEPNVRLCRKELEPLGIRVVQVVDHHVLPFETDSFDIVINRHEIYDLKEVKRILKPNGMFITQQVGGQNNEVLSKRLIAGFRKSLPDFNLETESHRFIDEGFACIFEKECFRKLQFYDVGAVVFYAKIIEWEFPKFSVNTCFDALCRLQDELSEKGVIESKEHRFILVAKNTK